jgi:hypothetical protein
MKIHVPKQTVHIPGNQLQVIEDFVITSRPITAAEFALFAKRAQYVTVAERERGEFSVYANPSLDGVPFADWSTVPALFVSREDVAAFCRYHQVNLPTPGQWVAFVRYVSENHLFALHRETKTRDPQLGTHFSGREWLKADRILGRPPMVQLPGVASSGNELVDTLVEHDDYAGDISITFRVVVEGR